MNHILLLDVAPDPVSAGVGIAGLVLIGVAALMLTVAVLVGFVFLFKRLRRNDSGPGTRLVVAQTSPNQP